MSIRLTSKRSQEEQRMQVASDECDDFTAHQNDFALYRERIHGEKKRFEQETAAFAEAVCRM